MKFSTLKTKKEVLKEYPLAQEIVKVDGGYLVFFYMSDYEIWKNQTTFPTTNP